jgi:hypothetical protein
VEHAYEPTDPHPRKEVDMVLAESEYLDLKANWRAME